MANPASEGLPNTTRLSTTVRMPCKLGLHARTAALFMRFAAQFTSEIVIRKGNQAANGRSIIGLLMLGACWGCELEIEATGADAAEAIRAMEIYFSHEKNCADDE